ncbi:alpha/beta fold hydrolase [Nocardioides sp. WS12]|uniref:alpha/beta fold hydrolase n=1 Tax=Nocardioides sp. WS12 TaxID=2486272 RepID=UPI0015FD528F|nr:alpha/beta fold hydrolase [Nocardioides sp. WS12]
MRSRIGVVVVLAASLLGGCGGDDGSKGEADDARSTGTTSAPTQEPWQALDGPLGRCGPQPADVADAGFAPTVLQDEKVGKITAVTAGTGPTVAILLHQTDGNGLCGWLAYAADLVAEPGVQVLAIDLCGFGESTCHGGRRSGPAQADAVRVAVREARTGLQATRVVVVGASMGGSVALMTAASDAMIDTAVDLSGPVDWAGIEVIDGGRGLRVPVLVAMADDEGEEAVVGSQAIVDLAPAGSRFEPAESGHGYALLFDEDDQPTALAETVAAWIRG